MRMWIGSSVVIGAMVSGMGCDGGRKEPEKPAAPAMPPGDVPPPADPAPPPTPTPAPPPARAPDTGANLPVAETVSGRLMGGIMAIGAETTGWMLVTEEENGRPVDGVEVDMSRVLEAAQRLDGARVKVRGVVVERRYVERGVTKVLVAESVEAE